MRECVFLILLCFCFVDMEVLGQEGENGVLNITTADTVVDAGHPIFYEGPKLEFLLVGEDKQPLDSVMLRVFDAEHRLLGEYCSSGREHLFMPALIVLVDTAAINYYGTYYIEASKPGYRTKEIRYDLATPKPGERVVVSGFTLEREGSGEGGGAWLAVAVVVVAGGAWWLARRWR